MGNLTQRSNFYNAKMFWTVSQVVGALLLIHVGCRIVAFIHLYFLRSSSINRYLRSDNKAYALVTGATDGIGLALTKALLSRGFNAILHSRSEEKLQRISEQLRSEFPKGDVLYVAADASDPKTALPKVAAAVGRLEGRGGKLTVLVNNLGGQALFGGRTFNYFKDIPFEQVEASMNLNAIFPVLLTRLLLPSLLPTGHDGTTDQNEKALIINLGSYAGHYTIPLGAPYGISKALLHHFTRVLHLEASMTQPNLEVLGIMLAQVQTTGQGGDHTSFT